MLTRDVVEKIANLARLEFSEDELSVQMNQLNLIVEMMEGLNKIDTADVKPLNHVMDDVSNVFREDLIQDSMSISDVLKNAPEETDNMFQVPRIV